MFEKTLLNLIGISSNGVDPKEGEYYIYATNADCQVPYFLDTDRKEKIAKFNT